jgi:hypothetical protein
MTGWPQLDWSEKSWAEIKSVAHHEQRQEQPSASEKRKLLKGVGFGLSGRNSACQQPCDSSHSVTPFSLIPMVGLSQKSKGSMKCSALAEAQMCPSCLNV